MGSVSGSVTDVDDRVVMVCEDIPSEGSSTDSGRGSNSPGARSSSEFHPGEAEVVQGWSSRSFHGRERRAPAYSSARPGRQLSLREVRHLDAPPNPGDHYAVRSTLHVRQLYGFHLTMA